MAKPTINTFVGFEADNAGQDSDMTVTFPAGSNRYCLVGVAFNNNDNQEGFHDDWTVTIDPGGGDELELAHIAGSGPTAVGGDDGCTDFWGVADPPVGTFTVRVHLEDAPTRSGEKFSMGCWPLEDVDSVTDAGTFECDCPNGNITVTTTVDDVVFGCMFAEDGSSITVDSPGVEDAENTAGGDASHFAHQDGEASTTNLEWSYSSDKTAGSAVSVLGIVAGGSLSIPVAMQSYRRRRVA